jgi:hypothetical protein
LKRGETMSAAPTRRQFTGGLSRDDDGDKLENLNDLSNF